MKKFDDLNSFITIYNILYIPIFITNLISVFLLCKKEIYWQLDHFILYKIKDQSKVVVVQLIDSLFILFNIDLPDFVLLSQNSNVNKLYIKTIHR